MSLLLVLTGKTASGKDTIKQQLLSKYPNLKKVITTTSRTARNGEVNGVDYHFLTREDFEQKVRTGEFAEYVEYGGNLYGTFKKELETALNSDVLWRIDPSRAGEARDFLRRAFPARIAEELIQSVIVFYITVPDRVVLDRLAKRAIPEKEIQKRMEDDIKIWQRYKDSYDYVIENEPGKLDEAVNKITQIIDET